MLFEDIKRHRFVTSFILVYDCNVLPGSMNGGNFVKGCPGAVNTNGSPSYAYCTNTASNGHFPWWGACCEWKDGNCVPKESGNTPLASNHKLKARKILYNERLTYQFTS